MIDLLMGEVFLGDEYNTYLYIGEDVEAQQIAMGSFIHRLNVENQSVTRVLAASGKVIVNENQTFLFRHAGLDVTTVKGLRFDRIFIDVANEERLLHLRRAMMFNLNPTGGDFI